jgi:hypothetical protein
LRTQTPTPGPRRTLKRIFGLTTVAVLALPVATAGAGSGGVSIDGSSDSETTTPGSKAELVNGRAIPPADAPPEVVAAIEAANKIRKKPYVYGGGHQRWRSKGYDCSGAVSYALGPRGAGLIKEPLDSTDFMKWGRRAKGSWITVYSNPGHAYAVIAGLRWDTSMTPGDGPGWSKKMRSAKGYKKRHKLPF